jgi:thiaminase/transcriptional activator TenA
VSKEALRGSFKGSSDQPTRQDEEIRSMRFSSHLWHKIEGIMGKIFAHPFLTGLTDGSLGEKAFRHYVVQDALYLRDYARGLALLAAKSPQDEWTAMFSEHAKIALVVERALHESFFKDWDLNEEQVYAMTPAPFNLLYTSYLLRVAYDRPFHEALAAFLPCYWIYWEVGKTLEKNGSPNEMYQRWIDTYSSDEFAEVTRQVIEIMDQVAEGLTEQQRKHAATHFLMTSRFEYLFWDMGYSQQGWPI